MTTHRVAVFPRHRGDVLVQRRDRPDSRWTALTVESCGEPETLARQRLHAATGTPVADTAVVRVGEPVEVATDGSLIPVLVDAEERGETDGPAWEWVAPPSLRSRTTVPWLATAYDAVRPSVATVAGDTSHGSTTLSVRALEVLRDEAAYAGAAEEETDPAQVRAVARDLIAARPAMTAVRNRVNRAVAAADDDAGAFAVAVARSAHEGVERAIEADEAAAANAAERVEDGRIATLSRSGTVLTALESAAPAALLIAASQPGGEGVGVAETLADRTEVTLTTDAAFPSELARWEADALLVGADTVLPDGSVRNKVGTYPAAAVAAREDVPVFVVTATDKISPGSEVERKPWPGESPYSGDAPLAVANPTFDVTPPACLTAILAERGALDPDDVPAIAGEHRELAGWDDRA
jgi:ribose 1,5-bisphosphate isomerase